MSVYPVQHSKPTASNRAGMDPIRSHSKHFDSVLPGSAPNGSWEKVFFAYLLIIIKKRIIRANQRNFRCLIDKVLRPFPACRYAAIFELVFPAACRMRGPPIITFFPICISILSTSLTPTAVLLVFLSQCYSSLF